ncbi:MAG: hypothetical protein U0P81_01310 [Holophagaceae bacterium]
MPVPAALVLTAALQAPAPLPPDLAAVHKAFQAALAADDPAALAKVTRFPLRSNEFGVLKDAAALKRGWGRIFPPAVRAALAKGSLERTEGVKDTFEAFSDAGGLPIRFLFTRTQAGWRFSALDNINE